MDRLRMGLGKPVQAPSLGFVMIPTTLSAAEFSPFAGVVDERLPRKEGYTHEHLTPSTVVLDATMTQATPARLWFSIGHALGGTAGMPHGETSCVMLPHALHFNAPVNAARQALLSETMGRPGIAAGDVMGDLVAALGMPTRLRDAGVSREILKKVADEALVDHCTKTNPRPIESVDQILGLLEQAW